MKNIIQVDGIYKRYNYGSQNVKESFLSTFVDPFLPNFISRETAEKKLGKNDFWALKNVSFNVNEGEIFGIIGANGAGKSTILKILSRITPPTFGSIKIKGSISSLLEVGTGFNPELSGRENIYLNGAILGMKRQYINSKFKEIVDFSGVNKFIDTPVKRYSSGMYTRLAFAVAAHLRSEILIVDEVLSVGDAEFQKKSLGKMGDVTSKEGRTIIFVSHNMEAIKKLCNRGILLENGKVKMAGDISKLIKNYTGDEEIQKSFTPFMINEIELSITKISLNKGNKGKITPFQPLKIDIDLYAKKVVDNIGIQLMISHADTNGTVFVTNTKTTHNIDVKIKKGKNTITCLIESFDLCSGKYWLGFAIDHPFISFYYHNLNLLSFNVAEIVSEPRLITTSSVTGHVYLKNRWIIKN